MIARDGKPEGQRVFVYFNLQRKVWSVKALSGPHKGLVIAHSTDVALRYVTPRVSQAGRQRVLRDRQKNVHAGLVGTWVPSDLKGPTAESSGSITYNPYKYATFVYTRTLQPYEGSRYARLQGRMVTVGDVINLGDL